jgi:SRSO17 transposase
MDGGSSAGSEARFAAYVEALGVVLGHADRQQPMHDYCLGLLMPIERKSVEPMAAVTAPAQVAAKHQSLLHFVGNAPWSDAAMLAKVGELVLPAIERSGPVEVWIIDDTGFPKKGRHSVGVTRQYCGQLGKQDNCQVAVTLSLANHDASLPIAYRLSQRIGPRIRRVGTRPRYPRRWLSTPSPRSPSSRSKPPESRRCLRVWC